MKRVESLLRDEISLLIMNDRIKDPRVNHFLTVTRVKAAKDISNAKIFISSFESEKVLCSGVNALNHAAGFIQKEIGRKMRTRTTPKLIFIVDTSIRDGFEVNKTIDKLSHSSDSDTE